MGLNGWLVKVSWLGKLVSVFWWVELDFFSLECKEASSSELCDVSGFGVTLGSLYTEAQGYVSVLLKNLRGMSCSGTCWPLGGAWFQSKTYHANSPATQEHRPELQNTGCPKLLQIH